MVVGMSRMTYTCGLQTPVSYRFLILLRSSSFIYGYGGRLTGNICSPCDLMKVDVQLYDVPPTPCCLAPIRDTSSLPRPRDLKLRFRSYSPSSRMIGLNQILFLTLLLARWI